MKTPVAFDAVDEFIKIGTELANNSLLSSDKCRPATEDLYQITRRLLKATSNMKAWLNRFLDFDFYSSTARADFKTAAAEFTKEDENPGGFKQMKWACSDIEYIYRQRLDGQFDKLMPDQEKVDEARRVFRELGKADGEMVQFIATTVVAEIRKFVNSARDCVDRFEFNEAERRRLNAVIEYAPLSERLLHYVNSLSNLVMQFARLAGRPITLDP